MVRFFSLCICSILVSITLFAQSLDVVVFSDDGAKFTLVIDGDVKNAEPLARVVATGIRTETPVFLITFANKDLPSLKRSLYLELGKEYTLQVTTNNKGERVLRPTGEAALGTAVWNVTDNSTVTEIEYDDVPEVVDHNVRVPDMDRTHTTTVFTETTNGDGENVNIDMGVNGKNFKINVGVNDSGTSTTTTTHSHTTTTTVTNGNTPSDHTGHDHAPVAPVTEPAVYSMPGYTGPIGCAWPMSSTEYSNAVESIKSKSFEDTKMTTAKQVGRDRCFTAEQVKGILGTFSFEDTKLEFAKYAYERTYDIGNYYKINDAFTFTSSVDELNNYTQGR